MKVRRRPRRGVALLTAGIGVTMIIGCEQSSTSGNLLPPAGMEIPNTAGNVAGEPAGEFISGNLLPPAGMEGGESGLDIDIDMSVPGGAEAGTEAGAEAGAEAGTDG